MNRVVDYGNGFMSVMLTIGALYGFAVIVEML